MHHPRVKGPELFRCLVLPVVTYGCEVWAPTFNTFDLGGHLAAMRRAAGPHNPETLQLNFYRHLFGLRKTTPPSTILLETASTTIQYHWWALIIAYWNRLISTRHSPLLRAALQASLELSKHTSACWAARVRQGVASLVLTQEPPTSPSKSSSLTSLMPSTPHSCHPSPPPTLDTHTHHPDACAQPTRHGSGPFVGTVHRTSTSTPCTPPSSQP